MKLRHPVPKPAARSSRPWLAPAGAALMSFVLRLWLVLSMRNQPFSWPSPQVIDSWYYHNWAQQIVKTGFRGDDVFFLRPLLPYLLAPFYALLGPRFLPFQLFQCLLAAASCLLLWDITRRLFNRTAAALASFGFALTAILVFYTGAVLYVEITTLLSLLTVWLMLVAGTRFWRWLLCGLAFGLLVICRPEFLVLLPAFLIWLWRTRVHVRFTLAMSAAALVVVAAVPVRNYLVARDPVLFTAHSGINFYYGNNPEADGTWQPTGNLEKSIGFSHEKLQQVSRTIDGKTLPWSQASAYWLGKAFRFIFSQPLAFLKLLGRKLLLFLSNYEVPNNYYPDPVRASSPPLRLAFLDYGLCLAGAALGMALAWRHRRRVAPLYFVVAAFLFSSLAFYVLSRLRAPLIPFLLAFAGFALAELWRAFRSRDTRRVVVGLLVIAVGYAGSNLIPANRRDYATQGWTQLGNIWLEHRQAGPAIAALRRALEFDPANVNARYSLVQVYAGMGKVNEAQRELAALADAAGSGQGSRLFQMAQARVAIARRDFPIAAALYQTVLQQDPGNAEAWYLLGLVHVSTGDFESAADALGRAVQLDPANPDAAAALERIRQRLGR